MDHFWPFSKAEAPWLSAGLVSAMPDLTEDAGTLSKQQPCRQGFRAGCRVFQVPGEAAGEGDGDKDKDKDKDKDGDSRETLREIDIDDSGMAGSWRSQLLVFRYRGKVHAVDHECPHSSYPLSQGVPFDIEDFGVVLSAGLTCPKHGWSFDLFSGRADRGSYELKKWEVQLRDIKGGEAREKSEAGDAADGADQEVWVRRKQKQRMG